MSGQQILPDKRPLAHITFVEHLGAVIQLMPSERLRLEARPKAGAHEPPGHDAVCSPQMLCPGEDLGSEGVSWRCPRRRAVLELELTFSQPGWLQAWTRLPFFARLIRCVGVVPSLSMVGMARLETVEELVLEDDRDASEGCLFGVRRVELALAPKTAVVAAEG